MRRGHPGDRVPADLCPWEQLTLSDSLTRETRNGPDALSFATGSLVGAGVVPEVCPTIEVCDT